MMEAVLEDLRAAGVRAEARKEPAPDLRLTGGELDVEIARTDWPRTRRTLEANGWRYLRAPGRGGHRFMLRCELGAWFKVDVKFASTTRAAGGRRVLERMLARTPPSLRRSGPLVAVLGPDGAGKGTVTSKLVERLPVAVEVAYFGSRSQSSDAKPPRTTEPPVWRESAWLLVRFGRTWLRLLSAYGRAWRGRIVLCDRHPIEVLAVRPPRRPVNRRLERLLLTRLMPRPDAIVVLDAPGEVLFARKGEHSPEVLERWRMNYRAELAPLGAITVSTEGSVDDAVTAASEVVWRALCKRRRW